LRLLDLSQIPEIVFSSPHFAHQTRKYLPLRVKAVYEVIVKRNFPSQLLAFSARIGVSLAVEPSRIRQSARYLENIDF
jgi:hypothetical protein